MKTLPEYIIELSSKTKDNISSIVNNLNNQYTNLVNNLNNATNDLENNYYKTNDLTQTLNNNYYTKNVVDSKINTLTQNLTQNINNNTSAINTNLNNNYTTKNELTNTVNALNQNVTNSILSTQQKITSTLSNYYTKEEQVNNATTIINNQISSTTTDLLNQSITYNSESTNNTNKSVSLKDYLNSIIFSNRSPKIGFTNDDCQVSIQISGLSVTVKSFPIYLGGYYSVAPDYSFNVPVNSENYVYVSRDTTDVTKVNFSVSTKQFIDPNQTVFSRILIAKVVSGSNSINSIDTYKINDVSKLIDRVVKLESLLAKHNLT